jgi:ribose transport system permease protein
MNRRKLADFGRKILTVPEVGLLIPLLLFVVVFALINPIFISPRNLTTMVRAMSFIGVIGLGMAFLMISGEFDLSVGTTAGLCAIVWTHFMVNIGWAIFPSILAALATGALVGAVNSFVVLRMGVPAFIATLAMMFVTRGFNYLICQGYSIYPLPEPVKVFGQAQPLNISWSFFIFIGLAVIMEFVLRKTTYGRKLYAVGGNKEVARIAGINPDRIKTSGFIITGMASSAAGMLLAARIITGQPTIGAGWELQVIAALVIGGVSLWGGSGSIIGAIIGLLIMQVVNNGLVVVGVDPYWQTIATGAIMILAVYIDILRRKAKIAASRDEEES